MRLLGDISYSIYLIHPLVVWALKPVFAEIGQLIGVGSPLLLAATLVTFAIVIPLAWLTHRLVERPCIALGRRLARTVESHS
jgi:peptidoglycan/LPS O-acetylase OafA/YrhL